MNVAQYELCEVPNVLFRQKRQEPRVFAWKSYSLIRNIIKAGTNKIWQKSWSICLFTFKTKTNYALYSKLLSEVSTQGKRNGHWSLWGVLWNAVWQTAGNCSDHACSYFPSICRYIIWKMKTISFVPYRSEINLTQCTHWFYFLCLRLQIMLIFTGTYMKHLRFLWSSRALLIY